MPEGFRFPGAWLLGAPQAGSRELPTAAEPRRAGLRPTGAWRHTRSRATGTDGPRRHATAFPDTHKHLEPRVVPYIDSIFGAFSANSTSEVFMGNLLSVLLVFLVCGNVALLMFARAATRENEILVRTALGASRGRIIGQLFVEALGAGAMAALVAVTSAQVAWHSLFAMVTENMFDNRVPFWMHSSVSPMSAAVRRAADARRRRDRRTSPGAQSDPRHRDAPEAVGPGGGGLRFGGIWTVLIVMQVAVMAIVPTPVIAIYRDVVRGHARERPVPDQYLAATMAMDPREGARSGRRDVHGSDSPPRPRSSSDDSRPNPASRASRSPACCH